MNGQVIEQLTVKARLALLTNAWRIKTHALKFYFMGASRKGASTLKLRYIMNIGVLSSISIVLMLFNFPLPPFPNFLQVDFSDVPALLAAMTMGPVAGILVELLKNMLDWLLSGSITGVPVGHIANFTTGVLFIIPVTFFSIQNYSVSRG